MTAGPILLILHGRPPRPGHPVPGMGLRAWTHAEGLRHRGFDVVFATRDVDLAPDGGAGEPPPVGAGEGTAQAPLAFHDATDLAALVERLDPAVIVVEAADEVTRLPARTVPVVLDLFAPRLLERQFQDVDDVEEPSRLLEAIWRADYFLFSNVRQRDFHLGLLAAAGVDCRDLPAAVVPLSCPPRGPRVRRPREPVLVTGGVFWPWNDTAAPLRVVAEHLERRGRGRLRIFGGGYGVEGGEGGAVRDPREALPDSERVSFEGFVPYDDLLRAYARATAAVDLALPNLERELSFGFRHVDYLSCGLPAILGDHTLAGAELSAAGAALAVDVGDPLSPPTDVDRVLDDADAVAAMGRAARRRARERHAWTVTVEPLAAFCRRPRHRPRREAPAVRAFAERNRLAEEVQLLRQRLEAAERQVAWSERRAAGWEEERDVARAHAREIAGRLEDVVRSHAQIATERDRAWQALAEARERMDDLEARRAEAWEAHDRVQAAVERLERQRAEAWEAHAEALDRQTAIDADRQRAWEAHDRVQATVERLERQRVEAWEAHDRAAARIDEIDGLRQRAWEAHAEALDRLAAVDADRQRAWEAHDRALDEARRADEERGAAWSAHDALLQRVEELDSGRREAWRAHGEARAQMEALDGARREAWSAHDALLDRLGEVDRERQEAWRAHGEALEREQRAVRERRQAWEAHDQALQRLRELEEERGRGWEAHAEAVARAERLVAQRDEAWQAERAALETLARAEAALAEKERALAAQRETARADLRALRDELTRTLRRAADEAADAARQADELRARLAALAEERDRLEQQLRQTIGWRVKGQIERLARRDGGE